MKIFIQIRGKAQGPCPVEEVKLLLANGWLSITDLAQYEGDTEWRPLSSMPEVQPNQAEVASLSRSVEPSTTIPGPPRRALSIPFKPILVVVVLVGILGGSGYWVSQNWTQLKGRLSKRKPSTVAQAQKTNPAISQNLAVTNKETPASAVSNVTVASSMVAPENVIPLLTPRPQQVEAEGSLPHMSNAQTDPKKPAVAEIKTRRIVQVSIDVGSAPFGKYDADMLAAIQKRWLQILEEQQFLQGRTGRVVLEFKLNYTGRISKLKVTENTGDSMLGVLSEKAVSESAPYSAWPQDLRKTVDGGVRDVRFTFFY